MGKLAWLSLLQTFNIMTYQLIGRGDEDIINHFVKEQERLSGQNYNEKYPWWNKVLKFFLKPKLT